MAVRRLLWIALSVLVACPASAAAKARWFGFNDMSVARGVSATRDAKWLKRAGANAGRFTVDWGSVQPRRGDPMSFERADAVYKAWLARGIRPIFIVTGAPSWAWAPLTRCTPPHCHYPPARSADDGWRAFVTEVARRYPRLLAIEVWNEPNLRFFWQSGPDAQRYTELLRIAHDAIKAVAPTRRVLGASLAPGLGRGMDSQGEGMVPFLRKMYANGARGLMDGISLHPYPSPSRLNGRVYEAIDTVRAVRDEAGDPAPLWLTELGLSTTGPALTGGFSENVQANVLEELVPRLRRRADVAAVLLHTLMDPPDPDPAKREDGYGILHGTFGPKPAFCALTRRRHFCRAPRAPRAQRREWAAQERLQAAVEAALRYHSEEGRFAGLSSQVLHALDTGLSPRAPGVTSPPGPDRDPTRIAVLNPTDDQVQLCNTSRAARSQCVEIRPDVTFRFTAAEGSIAAAAGPDAVPW
jgi:hypothetical protein